MIVRSPAELAIDHESFLAAVANPTRREDARAICTMLERITGHEPQMWGPAIIGLGSYRYQYDSGHEGKMCRLGFSPRKGQLVLYVLTGAEGEADLLSRLGKHKIGKSCLTINKLVDVDMSVLEALAARAWNWMNHRYPDSAVLEGIGEDKTCRRTREAC